ncbi:MAG: hypothetical protein ACR2LK_00605, partial [Solirubrobacteraceae bacterium]
PSHGRSRGPAMAQAALAPHPAPRPRISARPPLRVVSGGASIALRVAEAAMEVSGSRTMDRLVRSRGWVVIVGFCLIGIVAMQVSMLKLNSGISRAVEAAATLERTNATLRGDVSRLSSGERIQAQAGQRGYVMPEPADVTFLRSGGLRSDGARAARAMTAPDPTITGPAGSALPALPATLAPDIAGTPQAGADGQPHVDAPAAPQPADMPQPAQPAAPPPTDVAPTNGAAAATPPAPTAQPAQSTPAGGVTVP